MDRIYPRDDVFCSYLVYGCGEDGGMMKGMYIFKFKSILAHHALFWLLISTLHEEQPMDQQHKPEASGVSIPLEILYIMHLPSPPAPYSSLSIQSNPVQCSTQACLKPTPVAQPSSAQR